MSKGHKEKEQCTQHVRLQIASLEDIHGIELICVFQWREEPVKIC